MRRLIRSSKGAGAVEFALIAPVIFAFIVGLSQLGMLFFANAGLKSAVAEGARYATVFPRPTDAQIAARISDRGYAMQAEQITTSPAVVSGTVNGRNYVDITMTYSVPLDFIFFTTTPVSMTESRRVFVYPCDTLRGPVTSCN